MRKKLFAAILCGVITFILVQWWGNFIGTKNVNSCIATQKAFEKLPENTVEVMIYGSSHAWNSIDPIEMYKHRGVGAYNYASSWQHINTTELFVYDSLQTQSPKVILIECVRTEPLIDVELEGEIYYTREIKGVPEKKDYLESCFQKDWKKYVSYYFPIYIFHENWSDVSNWNFNSKEAVENMYSQMGYYPLKGVTEIEIWDPEIIHQIPVVEEGQRVLDNIVERCKENNIELILFTAPYNYGNNYNKALTEYAADRGCTYIDLFEKVNEIGIDVKTDFADEGHLNDVGAKKISRYLAEYLSENFELTDMREIEGNVWSEVIEQE